MRAGRLRRRSRKSIPTCVEWDYGHFEGKLTSGHPQGTARLGAVPRRLSRRRIARRRRRPGRPLHRPGARHRRRRAGVLQRPHHPHDRGPLARPAAGRRAVLLLPPCQRGRARLRAQQPRTSRSSACGTTSRIPGNYSQRPVSTEARLDRSLTMSSSEATDGPAPAVGRSSPLGATVVDGGVNFSLFSRTADRRRAAALRPRGRRARRPASIRARPGRPTAPTTTGTRSCPGVQAGAALRLPRARAARPGARAALRPGQGAARPVRPRRGRARRTTRRDAAPAAGRQRRDRDEERRRRPGRLRLGGRRPAAPAVGADDHLRDARPRLHPPPQLRRRRSRPAAPTPA